MLMRISVASVKQRIAVLAVLASCASAAFIPPAIASSRTRNCGRLARVYDGPAGIKVTARGVSCRFARHWAYLLRCPPHWKRRYIGVGLPNVECSSGPKSFTRGGV
jgi:hypothetical protein